MRRRLWKVGAALAIISALAFACADKAKVLSREGGRCDLALDCEPGLACVASGGASRVCKQLPALTEGDATTVDATLPDSQADAPAPDAPADAPAEASADAADAAVDAADASDAAAETDAADASDGSDGS